jgi:hypothetical protein
MHRTIAKENTHLGAELEFARIVLTQTGPTRTAKCAEERILWRCVEQAENWSGVVDDGRGHPVDKITSSKKSLIPIPKGHRGMS